MLRVLHLQSTVSSNDEDCGFPAGVETLDAEINHNIKHSVSRTNETNIDGIYEDHVDDESEGRERRVDDMTGARPQIDDAVVVDDEMVDNLRNEHIEELLLNDVAAVAALDTPDVDVPPDVPFGPLFTNNDRYALYCIP